LPSRSARSSRRRLRNVLLKRIDEVVNHSLVAVGSGDEFTGTSSNGWPTGTFRPGSFKGIRKGSDFGGLCEPPGCIFVNQLRYSADRSTHCRPSAGHRFNEGKRSTFGKGGQDQQVRVSIGRSY